MKKEAYFLHQHNKQWYVIPTTFRKYVGDSDWTEYLREEWEIDLDKLIIFEYAES